MTALTQHLRWDIPGIGVGVMLSGYALALVVAGLFAIECHLGVRKTRRVDQLERQLAGRDGRIVDLADEREFLCEQNRALYRRLDDTPHARSHHRSTGCRAMRRRVHR